MNFDGAAVEVPVKFQNDWIGLNPNLGSVCVCVCVCVCGGGGGGGGGGGQ